MEITNNEIKAVKALASKKTRDEEGLFVVEGEKMVAEALKSSFSVEKIYRKEEVGDKAMERMTLLTSPSPVLAVVRKPADLDDASCIMKAGGLYLALDCIRDPGNMGTILRIADWFGADGVFAAPDSVDVFNPKVVQATMGAIFRVPFHYTSIPELCSKAVKAGGKVFGTFLDGVDMYSSTLDFPKNGPIVIVIGNESNGISPETAAVVTDRLYIPPFPADRQGSESLNAAVATAITVAEFRRQQR